MFEQLGKIQSEERVDMKMLILAVKQNTEAVEHLDRVIQELHMELLRQRGLV